MTTAPAVMFVVAGTVLVLIRWQAESVWLMAMGWAFAALGAVWVVLAGRRGRLRDAHGLLETGRPALRVYRNLPPRTGDALRPGTAVRVAVHPRSRRKIAVSWPDEALETVDGLGAA